MICLGSTFEGNVSPYDHCNEMCQIKEGSSKDFIKDRIKDLCQPENFNYIIDWQNKWIISESRYTEMPTNINRLIEAIL